MDGLRARPREQRHLSFREEGGIQTTRVVCLAYTMYHFSPTFRCPPSLLRDCDV